MPKSISNATKQELLRIHEWIEHNKHKYPYGIENSTMFAECVEIPGNGGRFSVLERDTPDYHHYTAKIARYRRKGYMRFEAPSAGERKVWSVNENYLPAGSVTYTGVRNSPIGDLPKPAPKPPVVLPPVQPVDKEKLRQEGVEYLEDQLKELWVNGAQLEHKYGVASFKRVSLYTLYKTAQALATDQASIAKAETVAEEESSEDAPF